MANVPSVIQGIKKMEGEFQAALPKHIPSERFTRNAVTVVNSSPELLGKDVDRRSLYASIMKAAQHGLIVDGKEAALVSFYSKKKSARVVNYIPMVEGLMKLVRNSGEVSVISVHVVHENDQFSYELGDNESMIHKPALTDRGDIIGAYSIVTFRGGMKSREWMSKIEIDAIKDRSPSGSRGPWITDYSEMCRKTVFRRHAKRLPKSSDMDEIIHHDDSIAGVEETVPETKSDPSKAKGRQKAKKQSAAAQAVKESAEDSDVIDAEFEDVSDSGYQEQRPAPEPDQYDEDEIPV